MTEIPDDDIEQSLVAQVTEAGAPLLIRGGGSKGFYGNPVQADRVLECARHRGLVSYEPTELAITLRAGTRLAEVEALLDANGQQFPFEPAHFGPQATVGGMVAAGLSGPRRPYAASVRDALLGVRLLNGRGQVLDFGGRVMKNVAGYDLSRLMAGSLGVLGVLLQVSLKVAPTPVGRMTLVREETLSDALALMRGWARRSLPITATAWVDGRLYLRICASEEGLAATHSVVEGLPLADADAFWSDLREQRLAFFAGDAPLWRLSVRPATPPQALPSQPLDQPLDQASDQSSGQSSSRQLVEWGGALRWLRGAYDPTEIRAAAKRAGGHATLFRCGSASPPKDGVFTPLDPLLMRLHRNLKQSFDPAGLFNPGRLYPDL